MSGLVTSNTKSPYPRQDEEGSYGGEEDQESISLQRSKIEPNHVQNVYKQQESSRSRVYQGVDTPNLVNSNRDKSSDRILQSGKSKGSVSGSQSYYQ
jgi:hypothetical protein